MRWPKARPGNWASHPPSERSQPCRWQWQPEACCRIGHLRAAAPASRRRALSGGSRRQRHRFPCPKARCRSLFPDGHRPGYGRNDRWPCAAPSASSLSMQPACDPSSPAGRTVQSHKRAPAPTRPVHGPAAPACGCNAGEFPPRGFRDRVTDAAPPQKPSRCWQALH